MTIVHDHYLVYHCMG